MARSHVVRWSLLWFLLVPLLTLAWCLMLSLSIGRAQPAPFAIGARVQLTQPTVARGYPSLTLGGTTTIATHALGATGSVLGGPRLQDGVTWYHVMFDVVGSKRRDGWVDGALLGATTPDTAAPTVPTGLTAVPVAHNQVNLTWARAIDNVATAIVWHQVWRDGTRIATTASTNHQDLDAMPLTSPRYEVRSVDLAGNVSAPSAPVTVTLPAPGPHPLAALAPGTWAQLPQSSLKASVGYRWPPGVFYGVEVNEVFSEGGCAYDTTRHRILCWGGGHLAYGGNEIYQFSLETLQWARLTEPALYMDWLGVYLLTQAYPNPLTGDPDYTQPSPPHTYGSLVYDAHKDRLCSLNGFVGFPGYAEAQVTPIGPKEERTFCYDFATRQWQRLGPVASGFLGASTGYDPTTGLWWQKGNWKNPSAFASWDSRTDTWAVRNPRVPHIYDYNKTAAVDTLRRQYVALGSPTGAPVARYDLAATGVLPEIAQPTTGDTEILGIPTLDYAGRPGFVYVPPPVDRFVAWNGGGNVFTLDPTTWVWTKVLPATGNTVTPPGPKSKQHGIFTRWRYSEPYNVFVAIPDVDKPVYAYRLAGTTTPVPPVPPPAASLLNSLPTLEEERQAYRSRGQSWTPVIEPTNYPKALLRSGGAFTVPWIDVHNWPEGDDLYFSLAMWKRTGQQGYYERAAAWADYYMNRYRQCIGRSGTPALTNVHQDWYESYCYDRASFGLDHAWVGGLLAWWQETGDIAARTQAELIGSDIAALYATAVPGQTRLSAWSVRPGARHLLAATYLAEALPADTRWTMLRDTLIALWMHDPGWDATYGVYWHGENATDADWGAGQYASGRRHADSFPNGILGEAFWRAYQQTKDGRLKDRLIALTRFFDQHSLHPTYQYVCNSFGVFVPAGTYFCTWETPDKGTWDPVYTTAMVGLLVRGYQLTGEVALLDRAWYFWNRGTKGVYGSPTARTAPDTMVAHFPGKDFDGSSDWLFYAHNKDELLYLYPLFLGGGQPPLETGGPAPCVPTCPVCGVGDTCGGQCPACPPVPPVPVNCTAVTTTTAVTPKTSTSTTVTVCP